MKLGQRLKGDFKAVAPAIRKLTNEQLEEFQEKGEIEVLGHALSREDLKITYSVDPSLSSQYHAHADGQLLVLLDVTPSQEMVEEGVAREVISKIQKLRKKAGLQPRDHALLVWEVGGEGVGPSSLKHIANHQDHIEGTTKGPVRERCEEEDLNEVLIIKDQQQMKGIDSRTTLRMWLTSSTVSLVQHSSSTHPQ